jgi:hypothetical protein
LEVRRVTLPLEPAVEVLAAAADGFAVCVAAAIDVIDREQFGVVNVAARTGAPSAVGGNGQRSQFGRFGASAFVDLLAILGVVAA